MTTDPKLIEAMARGMLERVPFGYGMTVDEAAMYARAALSAAEEAGFAIVPREPTEAMIRAGDQHTNCGGPCGNRDGRGAYRAMLAAQ